MQQTLASDVLLWIPEVLHCSRNRQNEPKYSLKSSGLHRGTMNHLPWIGRYKLSRQLGHPACIPQGPSCCRRRQETPWDSRGQTRCLRTDTKCWPESSLSRRTDLAYHQHWRSFERTSNLRAPHLRTSQKFLAQLQVGWIRELYSKNLLPPTDRSEKSHCLPLFRRSLPQHLFPRSSSRSR